MPCYSYEWSDTMTKIENAKNVAVCFVRPTRFLVARCLTEIFRDKEEGSLLRSAFSRERILGV